MEAYLELVSVPAIAAVVYWIMATLRYALKGKKAFKRWIPLLSMILGAVFGVVAFYAVPETVPAQNVVVALVLGGVSGLTATGTHQMVKQICKKNCAESEPSAGRTAQKEREENKAGSDGAPGSS